MSAPPLLRGLLAHAECFADQFPRAPRRAHVAHEVVVPLHDFRVEGEESVGFPVENIYGIKVDRHTSIIVDVSSRAPLGPADPSTPDLGAEIR